MGIRISRAFPSKWLKADDIPDGRKVRVTIKKVIVETISDEDKPVMYFQGKEKGVVLNKTNAGRLAVAYGDDTDDWVGQECLLFSEQVSFQGRMVPAIRVEIPRKEVSWSEPEPPAVADDDPDAIPF